MTLVGVAELAARRRPGILLLVTLLRLLTAAVLALPFVAVLEGAGVGLQPNGDAALFEPGGLLLLEVLRLQAGELATLAARSAWLLLAGWGVTAVSTTLLLVAVNTAGRLRMDDVLPAVARRAPGVVLVGAASMLVKIVIVALGYAVSQAVPETTDVRVGDLVRVLVLATTLLVAGGFGGAGDVAQAALVRHGLGVKAALTQALRSARRAPLRTCYGFVPYAAAAVLAIALGALVTEAADVSRPGALRVAAVFVTHQLVVLGTVALRAAWLAAASRVAAGG